MPATDALNPQITQRPFLFTWESRKGRGRGLGKGKAGPSPRVTVLRLMMKPVHLPGYTVASRVQKGRNTEDPGSGGSWPGIPFSTWSTWITARWPHLGRGCTFGNREANSLRSVPGIKNALNVNFKASTPSTSSREGDSLGNLACSGV